MLRTYTFVEDYTAELVTEIEVGEHELLVSAKRKLPDVFKENMLFPLEDMNTGRVQVWRVRSVSEGSSPGRTEVRLEPVDLRVYMVEKLAEAVSAAKNDDDISVVLERFQDIVTTLKGMEGRAGSASFDILDAIRIARML